MRERHSHRLTSLNQRWLQYSALQNTATSARLSTSYLHSCACTAKWAGFGSEMFDILSSNVGLSPPKLRRLPFSEQQMRSYITACWSLVESHRPMHVFDQRAEHSLLLLPSVAPPQRTLVLVALGSLPYVQSQTILSVVAFAVLTGQQFLGASVVIRHSQQENNIA
jgi:hypothetical protein